MVNIIPIKEEKMSKVLFNADESVLRQWEQVKIGHLLLLLC